MIDSKENLTHLALRNLMRITLTRASPTGFEGSMGTPQRLMGTSLFGFSGNEVSKIYGSLVFVEALGQCQGVNGDKSSIRGAP